MSQNSEETSGISQSDMQLIVNMLQTFKSEQVKQSEHFERMNKHEKHFERMNNQLDKQLEQFEQLREAVKVAYDRREQLLERLSNRIENTKQEIRNMELTTCEKDDTKEIEAEDVEGQKKTNDNRQVEANTSALEEIPATEIRETKETRAMDILGRHGERNAPNKPDVDVKMSEETNHSKPRKSRAKSLAAAGACRKKKKYKPLKKKLEGLKKNTHGKSQKEAFQEWIDHVRKKHR
jgi:hypothetical protein